MLYETASEGKSSRFSFLVHTKRHLLHRFGGHPEGWYAKLANPSSHLCNSPFYQASASFSVLVSRPLNTLTFVASATA